MKIIHIINKFTHTSIPVEMAELMAAKGNDVTVLSLYDSQTTAEEFANKICKNCKVIGVNFKKNPILAIKKIKHCLQKKEIIHTHHALSGALVRILKKRNNSGKIVHTIHANHHSFNFKQNVVIGLTLNRADLIVCNSKSTLNGILKWQKRLIKRCKKEVIYNGIDTNRIINSDETYMNLFIDNNKIKSKEYIFSQIGRLEPVKNPRASLLAYQKLINRRKDIYDNSRFIYIGDGSQKNELEEIINKDEKLKNNVINSGLINRDEVYSMLKRIDSLVVPSLFEGFCNALFEAMTIGMNLVISDIEVFKELLDFKCDNIYRFEPKSIESIEKKLEESFDNRIDKEQKERMKNKAINNFDKEICIKKYLDCYKELI